MCRTSTELTLAFLVGAPVSHRFNFATMLTFFNYMVRGKAGELINCEFAVKVCKKHILDSIPYLRNADVGELHTMLELDWDERKVVDIWLNEQVIRFGRTTEVEPLSPETVRFLTTHGANSIGESAEVVSLR